MKIRTTLAAAAALATLSLSGCATQSQIEEQIEEQNKQLVLINASLTQIQAQQAEALALQKVQTTIQVEDHNLQAAQAEQLKRK